MADKQKMSKGLPKRTGKRHASNVAAWVRGEKRKDERRKAQAKREQANRIRRSQGIPTPWEASELARAHRRLNDPAVIARKDRTVRERKRILSAAA